MFQTQEVVPASPTEQFPVYLRQRCPPSTWQHKHPTASPRATKVFTPTASHKRIQLVSTIPQAFSQWKRLTDKFRCAAIDFARFKFVGAPFFIVVRTELTEMQMRYICPFQPKVCRTVMRHCSMRRTPECSPIPASVS